MAATSAAPRKAAPKKRTAAAPAAAGTEVRASVVLDPDRKAAPDNMFPIFAIGDVQYYAPIQPRAVVELRFLHMLRHQGEQQANAYLLEEMVGREGFEALMNYDALTADDLERIFTVLQEAVQGAAMGPGPKGGLTIS